MIRVKSIGQVEHHPSFVTHLQGKTILLPVGYEIERPIVDESAETEGKKKKASGVLFAYKSGEAEPSPSKGDVTFTASVQAATAADGSTKVPEFVVTRSDDPVAKRYVSDKSINIPWRAAVEDVENDFPTLQGKPLASRDAKGHLQILGVRLFGLAYAEVQAEIKGLPGATEALAAFPPPSTTAKASAGPSQEVELELEVAAPAVNVDASQGSQKDGAPKAKRAPRKSAVTQAGAATTDGSGAAKPKRTRTTSVSTTQETTTDKADGTTPAKKRTRTVGGAKSDATTSETAAASATVCRDCGLSGTPFCATTGRPHTLAPPPCAACGLTTAFCPVSGLPHAGTAQRPNRQRGEVHLPGKSTTTRRRKTAAAATTAGGATAEDGSVAEVLMVPSQEDGAKKPRAKRSRKASLAEGDAAGEGAVPPAKQPRTKRGAKAAAAAAEGGDGTRLATEPSFAALALQAGQPTLDATLVPKAQLEPEEPPKPKEYEYPPLRPPLSNAEQHRAANLQLRQWKENPEAAVCPAHVTALHLPFVAYRLPRQGAAAKKAKKEHTDTDGGVTEDADKEDADASDHEGDKAHQHGNEHDEEENNDDADTASVASSRKPKRGGGAAQSSPTTVMIHPLEVRDVASSAAGKRLLKFLQQYTSERVKGDLLRSAESEKKAALAAKRAEKKAAAAATVVEGEADGAAVSGENGVPGSEVKPEHADVEEPQPVAPEADAEKGTASASMPKIEAAAQE